jgi:hypothetical protein
MGTLLYGSPPSELAIDDRTLAHLKVVMISKLRRNEPFVMSWDTPEDGESQHMSLWIHPSIPLQFKFVGGRPSALNSEWLELLARSALTTDGLHVMPEPAALLR